MSSSHFDFAVVAPLGFVAGGAFAALVFAALLSSRRAAPSAVGDAGSDAQRILRDARSGTLLALLCLTCLAFAIYTAADGFVSGSDATFDSLRPLLVFDSLSTFGITLIGCSVMLSVLLSIAYLPALHIYRSSYYGLLMLSAAGMVVVACAVDLIVLYVGLEVMVIPLYAVVGLARTRATSGEAALKLVLTNAFASAVLLYGIAMLYGATGDSSHAALRDIFGANAVPGAGGLGDAGGVTALAGLALVLIGLGFKVAAFPFHSWAADVLHGAPTVVTSVFSVAVLAAAMLGLIRILEAAFADPLVSSQAAERLQTLLAISAAATMIVGSVMAWAQTSAKRMLAHAGVAHTGMLLLGLACATEEARASVLFYLVAYAFMSLGAFGVLIAMSGGGRDCERLDDFAGLGSRHPTLAAAMSLFVVALAGVPGTAGFMAKFHLGVSAVAAGQIELVLVAGFASVVLFACYLRIPVAIYMRAPSVRGSLEPGSAELLVLAVCAAVVFYLGFAPDGDLFGTGLHTLEVVARAAAFSR